MNIITERVLIFSLGGAVGIVGSAIFFRREMKIVLDEIQKILKEPRKENTRVGSQMMNYSKVANTRNKYRQGLMFVNDEGEEILMGSAIGELDCGEHDFLKTDIKPEIEPITSETEIMSNLFDARDEINEKEDIMTIKDVNVNFKTETCPYLISGEEFLSTNTEFEKFDLYYYEEDDVLTDTKDKIIDAPKKILGDLLNCFGLDPNENEDVIFVRNEEMCVDYEVLRFHDSYEESILGIDSERKGE